MNVLMLELIVDVALVGLGVSIGWIVRGSVTAAQSQLRQTDALSDANWRTGTPYCPRCGRLDGSHTTACERARLDILVAPVRGRKFDARGQAGSSLTPPVRRTDRRG
jgi:hypothetical protein